MKFNEQLKAYRIRKNLTLRQCSENLGVDPSNWSKLERGINPAPKETTTLEKWAAHLALTQDEKQSFIDSAAISRKELPGDIATDEKILTALPAFFRAARNTQLDDAQLREFIEDIRKIHSPSTAK